MMSRPLGSLQGGVRIFSVSELTRDIKILLETKYPTVSVEGEISNLRVSPTGHGYFTLKDRFSQISAVIFRTQLSRLSMELKDGMKVVLTGSLGVYEKRGSYQIIVSRVEEKGVGALQMAFERLKRKLYEEGLFQAEHKKPIPLLPEHIGVITSPTGAAIRDILNVLDRRFSNLHIVLNAVRVQGEEAAGEIVAALADFNRLRNVDVIILGRGGGSLEDLWPFNEESVARAIYASEIPVISAVGHEIDWTISDFVADVRAPTPSAAAEIVIGRKQELADRIESLRERLYHCASSLLRDYGRRLDLAQQSYVFREPGNLIRQYQQQVDEFLGRMMLLCEHSVDLLGHRVEGLSRRLRSVSPEGVLARGYSITVDVASGSTVSRVAQTGRDRQIRTVVQDGSFVSQVSDVNPTEEARRTQTDESRGK
jgi:exodeoxyribonuclease VII large subunit